MISLGSRGAELIKSYEALRLVAYKPTPNDVPTIGWGSTRGVKLGMTISLAQAEMRFVDDTMESLDAVNYLLIKMKSKSNKTDTNPLTQSMIDALVSLVFNVGQSCISSSSTIGKSLIAGQYYPAWRGFALWTKQRNNTPDTSDDDLLGLARRRTREMELFLADGIPK